MYFIQLRATVILKEKVVFKVLNYQCNYASQLFQLLLFISTDTIAKDGIWLSILQPKIHTDKHTQRVRRHIWETPRIPKREIFNRKKK